MPILVFEEVGAHCNNKVDGKSINLQSLGVCVGFDGDIEYMTPEHFKLLQTQVWAWQDYWNIPNKNVKFHREFNVYKTCPGTLIQEDFKTRLLMREKPEPKVEEHKQELLLQQLTLLQTLRDMLQRLIFAMRSR